MGFNGSGTFDFTTSGQPVTTATAISSTMFNALLTELETALSTCVTKDGQTTTTAEVPFVAGAAITALRCLSISNGAGLAADTYTPTGTGVTNIASVTPAAGFWLRVGNVVFVVSQGSCQVSATSTLTEIGLSLPVTSNLAAQTDLTGLANVLGTGGPVIGAYIIGSTVNDRARLFFISDATDTTFDYFTIFAYRVL